MIDYFSARYILALMVSALWITGLALAALILGWELFSVIQAEHRKKSAYEKAASIWLDTAHGAAVARALRGMTGENQSAAPAWFLLGCAHLQQGQPKEAAKAFGMAHHCDCRLVSAALLTFACLKARDDREDDLAEQISTTWDEMGKPDLRESRQDQQMVGCLEKKKGRPPVGSPPAQLIWLLTSPAERPPAT